MLPVHDYTRDFRFQHARDELRQLSVAKDGGRAELFYIDLIQDLAGGGQRFDEYGLFVGNGVRDEVQIFYRKREVFGESAVVIHDAENGAARAVSFQSAKTEFAERFVSVGGARDVDFAGDTLTGPARLFALDRRRWFTTIADGDDVADEFVPGNAAEVV